jgi:hypothetical protein
MVNAQGNLTGCLTINNFISSETKDYKMDWTTIIITNVVQPSKTAFGVREDTGEQVFVPPSVSKTMNLENADIIQAKLVPNVDKFSDGTQKLKNNVPWFAPLVSREAYDEAALQHTYSSLSEYEYPVTAEEAELPLAALQELYHQGRIVKMLIMPNPKSEKVIMWASSMEKV